MSMLTPVGIGGHRPRRRGHRRGRGGRRRTTGVLILLVIIALGGFGTWRYVAAEPARSAPPSAACPRPSPAATAAATTTVKPAQVTVNVYNATTRSGLAARTATQLERLGFVIGDVDNDPNDADIPGTAELRGGPAGGEHLDLLRAYVPDEKAVTDARRNVTVDLVLGKRFDTLNSPAEVTAELRPTPAARHARAGC
ncbi:MAG: LytR C-terminal domain-containing protein [Carbonactinosporaceae bacterium]